MVAAAAAAVMSAAVMSAAAVMSWRGVFRASRLGPSAAPCRGTYHQIDPSGKAAERSDEILQAPEVPPEPHGHLDVRVGVHGGLKQICASGACNAVFIFCRVGPHGALRGAGVKVLRAFHSVELVPVQLAGSRPRRAIDHAIAAAGGDGHGGGRGRASGFWLSRVLPLLWRPRRRCVAAAQAEFGDFSLR